MCLPLSLLLLLNLCLLVLERNDLLLELVVLTDEDTVCLVTLGHLFSHREELGDNLVDCFVIRLYLSLRSLGLILEEFSPIEFVKFVAHRTRCNHTFKDLDAVSEFSILSGQVERLVGYMVNVFF